MKPPVGHQNQGLLLHCSRPPFSPRPEPGIEEALRAVAGVGVGVTTGGWSFFRRNRLQGSKTPRKRMQKGQYRRCCCCCCWWWWWCCRFFHGSVATQEVLCCRIKREPQKVVCDMKVINCMCLFDLTVKERWSQI